MLKTPIARSVALAILSGAVLGTPVLSQAAFLEDSKARLDVRNFYMNNDNRQDGASQNYAEEWAQGFMLFFESGYTEGTVGFGIDALGFWGLKLDSGDERGGTGLLPVRNDGKPGNDYGKIGLTLKMKYSDTVARGGTLIPRIPVAMSNDTRLLKQTFRGFDITSLDIDRMMINFGRYTSISKRNESSNEKMYANNRGMEGVGSSNDTDKFDFAYATYKVTDNLTLGYNWGNLDNNYHQHYFTLNHSMALGEGKLSTDFRYARSSDDGDTDVDNRALGLKLTYAISGHKFAAAFQKMSGDTGFAYINGTDPYLVNYVQINHFGNADEESYQLRYDYDFAAIGIPGLTFMTRYLDGSNMDKTKTGGATEEWERDMDIGYTFQTGWFKDVNIKWRNASFRQNNGGSQIDQNRLIVNYSIPLL